MGATLIVDDPELAPVLSGTHLPTSEGWKAELAQEREEVGGLLDMTSTGNRIRVVRMVAQWFTNYATAAYNPTPSHWRCETGDANFCDTWLDGCSQHGLSHILLKLVAMFLAKVEIRFLKKSCDHMINESRDSVDQAPSAFLFIYLFYLFH